MKIKIRSAEKADKETLKAISRRTISANYRSFLGDESVEGFIGSGAADQYVDDNINQCSVILAEGDLVGFCVCKENLIDIMMIDHQFHRKGLGTQLLKHCEHMLFKTYDELKLESFEQNGKANSFYKKNGWLESKIYFDNASGVNKIIFTKRAKSAPAVGPS